MKNLKIIALVLSVIISLGLLCSCAGATGPQGPQGPQGEPGPAGKDGPSFLTGSGEPSSELGNVGDSYLDIGGEDDWGFYIKNENGWKLMGFLEAEPAPLTLNDLNGSYVLSHIYSNFMTYHIGEEYAGMTLSENMIQVSLVDGIGKLTVNFDSEITTNITCTMEYDMLIMICENSINITGEPRSVYELSLVKDGEIYVILESNGNYYYIKKVS